MSTDTVLDTLREIDGKVATSGDIGAGNAFLESIDDKVSTADKQDESKIILTNIEAGISGIAIDLENLDVPVSTRASEVTLVAAAASLDSIDTKLTSPLPVTGPLTNTQLRASPVPVSGTFSIAPGSVVDQGVGGSSAWKVDGSTVTQPISAAALPLPAGASTAALQTAGNASLTSIDSKLTSPISVAGPLTDTELRATAVPVSGTFFQTTQPISAVSLPLPTGASTSALQSTGNASLSSIDSKLTSPVTVTGPLTDTQLRASAVPVSASSLPLPSGAATSALQTSGNASLTSIDSKIPASPSQEHVTAASPHATRLSDGSAFYKATTPSDTQPISAVALPLPNGASTAANQATGNASLSSIDSKLTSPIAITGALTDTQLRATPVPVSGTFFQATQPVSAVSLPLPSGAATSALQTSGNASLTSIDSKLTSPIAVTGTFFQATQPVSLPSDVVSSTFNITTQDLATATTTGFGGQSFNIGTPTVGSVATMAVGSIQTVMVEIKGIWTGTLLIEVSSDAGITWVPRGIHIVGTNIFAATITSNAIGSMNATAKTNVRVRATAAISGTANVFFLTSDNLSNVYLASAATIKDGSATTSTTLMNIKAASTAAVATDTSVVVGLSPNSPIPTGTNTIGSVANVSGTVSLPTGASTSALQTTGNASLASIDSDIDVALSTRASAANQTNGTQKIQVTDGTNTASVKAASTAAVASDLALVVAISPNNALTIGTKTPLTGAAPTASTVGITSALALASNASRKSALFVNTSNNKISLAFGANAAVLNSGITLLPGGTFTMDEYSYTTAAVNAIASVASSNLAIQELT